MEQETKDKLKKMQIFAAVSLVLISTLFLFKTPGITGHFTADFKSQVLNMQIEQSQLYLLSSNNPEPIYVSSFRLSGDVTGDGSVEVYIENNGQKLLVYKNIREKEQGLPTVTGMAVAYAAEPGTSEGDSSLEEETLLLLSPKGTIEWKEELSLSATEEYVTGPFNNKCMDTCFIEMPLSSGDTYNLIFMVQPGTKLNINKITYTLKSEKI